MSETHYICELCREVVQPDDPGRLRAVELVGAGASGNPDAVVEGMGVFFDERCWPLAGDRYGPKPLP